MSTTAIIAELLVIGLLVLIALFFLILALFKVDNLVFLLQLKDFAGILAIATTIISYFLGALFTHLAFSGYWYIARIFQHILRIKTLRFLSRFKLIDDFEKTGGIHLWRKREVKTEIDVARVLYFVFENGSNSTIERIKYIHSLERLFKGLNIALPLLSFSFSLWLIRAFGYWSIAVSSLFIFVLIYSLLYIAQHTVQSDLVMNLKIADETIRSRIAKK